MAGSCRVALLAYNRRQETRFRKRVWGSVRIDPEGIVDGFYQAFRAGDQAGQLIYFADDATFHQHIPEGIIGYSGVSCGKPQLAERLAYMYAHWEMGEIIPIYLRVEGDRVHARMRFVFRFKASGDSFEGGIRHVFQVGGGRIVRLDEYVDAALLQAFLRMAAWQGANP